MRILISGASGLVGSALKRHLKACGHQVHTLVRENQRKSEDSIYWRPENGEIDAKALEGFDAVINLSGENIAGGRWNEERKKRILLSRLQATSLLTNTLSKLTSPPKTFISFSAIGFYGDSGARLCTEEMQCGQGFLADVCRQWEAAAFPIVQKNIRTINLRAGIVLSSKGGALGRMLPPFKLGLGGALGSGQQYMSWIAIDDLVAIILFALTNPSLSGPVNAVAPNPVTNAEFTSSLGEVLGRPTFMKVPAFALRLILGQEMADEFLLSSIRAKPVRLEQAGYAFLYPELIPALKHLIKEDLRDGTKKRS